MTREEEQCKRLGAEVARMIRDVSAGGSMTLDAEHKRISPECANSEGR